MSKAQKQHINIIGMTWNNVVAGVQGGFNEQKAVIRVADLVKKSVRCGVFSSEEYERIAEEANAFVQSEGKDGVALVNMGDFIANTLVGTNTHVLWWEFDVRGTLTKKFRIDWHQESENDVVV